MSCLRMNAGNVWAANGIGAVLAEDGRLAEAAEVLNAVQVRLARSTATARPVQEALRYAGAMPSALFAAAWKVVVQGQTS